VEIARALILAGRTDHDRPWPSVKSCPKHLVPVANRPILFHNLESLRRARLLEATIAVDAESAEPIIDAVGDGSAWNLSVSYVRWDPSTGVSGALAAAHDSLGDEPVLVSPGDALHRGPMHPHITDFASERLDAMALTTADSRQLSGRPMSAGYLLSRHGLALLLADPSFGGDPVDGIRRHGGAVRVREIDGCLACHGGQNALLEGNRHMLEELQRDVDPARYPSCDFQGAVAVHPTARLDHTLIRGPAVIGPGAQLSHAYVGPYTSIGTNVSIEGSQLEHSIVLDDARVAHLPMRLDSSVIGRGARITRRFDVPNAMRMSIGDYAEVVVD
jgi:glucose-1-phosphate thymidylyltransferase